MDCRFDVIDALERVEFSWEGEDDNDRGSGRGWAVLDGGSLRGEILIHLGEESAFEARRVRVRPAAVSAPVKRR